MKLSSLTLILTEQCNFNCSYCYQAKGEKNNDLSTIKKAIDFFSPYFSFPCYINFYGGEPTLEWDLITKVVEYIKSKDRAKEIKFSMTSNCSLLDQKRIEFLSNNHFTLLISFDGLAQEISREKGSLSKIEMTIMDILDYPDIHTAVNSIFIPETIHLLSASIKMMIEMNMKEINFGLSSISTWEEADMERFHMELEKLSIILADYYKENGFIPVVNFQQGHKKGTFVCHAGRNRLALSPDGQIWGCYLFWDYFKNRKNHPGYGNYCFGKLEEFMVSPEEPYPGILAHYSDLRMDYFCMQGKPCFSCNDIEHCMVCPIDAVFSGAQFGEVPPVICRINKTLMKYRKIFLGNLGIGNH